MALWRRMTIEVLSRLMSHFDRLNGARDLQGIGISILDNVDEIQTTLDKIYEVFMEAVILPVRATDSEPLAFRRLEHILDELAYFELEEERLCSGIFERKRGGGRRGRSAPALHRINTTARPNAGVFKRFKKSH